MTETVHGKYALEAPLCSTLGLTLPQLSASLSNNAFLNKLIEMKILLKKYFKRFCSVA